MSPETGIYTENGGPVKQAVSLEFDDATIEKLTEGLNAIIDEFSLEDQILKGNHIETRYKNRRGPLFRVESAEKDDPIRDISVIQAGRNMNVTYNPQSRTIENIGIHNFDEGYKKAIGSWIAPGVLNGLKHMWEKNELEIVVSKEKKQ
jgi:hypothetical protein